MQEPQNIVKFLQNRVRRSYQGGKGIDEFFQNENSADGNLPENWISSTVIAKNESMNLIKNEGLSEILLDGNKLSFINYLKSSPEKLLGKDYYLKNGANITFLVKLLDSAIRLSLQVHPTKQYAKEFLSSKYGKTEFYYIISVRENVDGYIYLGFQRPPKKTEFIEMVEKQESEKMLACFDKIKVKEGECWYVPGGMPHAIGEGILMIEVMEPSDLVVRYEYDRKGLEVPYCDRFMNKTFEEVVDIFDFTAYSVEEIKAKNKVNSKILQKNELYCLELLANESITDCFYISKITIYKNCIIPKDNKFFVAIVLKGYGVLENENNENVSLEKGDCVFISSSLKQLKFQVKDNLELFMVTYNN